MAEDREKDLYLSKDAVKRLIELLLEDVKSKLPNLTGTIPMTVEEANSPDVKDSIPTVLAVFNALSQIDHIKFRLMKGNPGQSFEDYMSDKTPEEVALYLYRTADTPNFDLWIYDSTQGFARVGKDSVSAGDLDLADYWSKTELDINAYWSKEELKLEDIVRREDLADYLKSADLDQYLKKDDIGTMSREELEAIWDEVKSAEVAAVQETQPKVEEDPIE